MFLPSPMRDSALQHADQWATADSNWSSVTNFGNALLAGHNFTYGTLGAFTSHLSTRVHSRTHNTDYDVTGYTQRSRPHWLRSRSTSP